MEKGNILNQMEQYDFSTPINVTMIFEDSDDEYSGKNILKEQHRNDNNKHKQTCINIEEKTKKSDINVVKNETKSTKAKLCKNNIVDTQRLIKINTHNISPNVKENKLPESSYSMPDITDDIINIDVSQSHLTKINSLVTNNTSSNIFEAPPDTQASESEELNEEVKKLLDIVSEHLTLIMIQYYNFYNQTRKSTAAKAAELTKKLNQFKAHLFDLSYSTVVTLILPQEKNELFIDNFLKKTVDDANKILPWKCTRRQIEPFYNEMIVWVKKIRDHVNSIKPSSDMTNNNMNINDNRTLKDRLTDPPRALYFSQTTNNSKELERVLPSPYEQNMNTDNNMCIFSSGTAENNISISINPDILVQQTRQHYEVIPQNLNITQNSTNSNIHRTKSPVAPNQAHYDQRFNHLEQNGYPQRSTINHRPVTARLPPYHSVHKVTGIPTNYKNLNQKNSAQNMQNYYQTQQNSNPAAVSVNVNSNLGHMYYTQIEERLNTTVPLISQVTSLNPNHSPNLVPFPTQGRCRICGKITTLRCSRCQHFLYCSHLCQELDAGHRTVCRH